MREGSERQRETETDRETERQTETERGRKRQTDRQKQRQRQRETETECPNLRKPDRTFRKQLTSRNRLLPILYITIKPLCGDHGTV